jgi:hypothetical protein
MGGEVGMPIIKYRTYFSSYHLWAAKKFTEVCGEIEDSLVGKKPFDFEHRAYVTATIISAVAFLEASINEVFQDAFDEQTSYVANLSSETRGLMKDFWGETEGTRKSTARILEKYQCALHFANVDKFNQGKSPYQDVLLVIDLRNELVHYKPKSLGGDSTHRLQNTLKGKFPENRLMAGSGNPFFPDKCLGKGCAKWAVDSSRKFADEFFKRIRIKPHYQHIV